MFDIFEYKKRFKYPHMNPADVKIWERFIDKFPLAYDTVQYDFNVGDPPPFNPLGDDDEDLRQDMLYRLRIDVIGHKPDHIDIIEIKPNAGASAIGQVEGYRTIYMRDELPKKKVNLVIITDRLKPNMEYLCSQKGVKLFIV